MVSGSAHGSSGLALSGPGSGHLSDDGREGRTIKSDEGSGGWGVVVLFQLQTTKRITSPKRFNRRLETLKRVILISEMWINKLIGLHIEEKAVRNHKTKTLAYFALSEEA